MGMCFTISVIEHQHSVHSGCAWLINIHVAPINDEMSAIDNTCQHNDDNKDNVRDEMINGLSMLCKNIVN